MPCVVCQWYKDPQSHKSHLKREKGREEKDERKPTKRGEKGREWSERKTQKSMTRGLVICGDGTREDRYLENWRYPYVQ